MHCFFCAASSRAVPALDDLLLLLPAAADADEAVDDGVVDGTTGAAVAVVAFLLGFFALFVDALAGLVTFADVGCATPCGNSFPRGPAGVATLTTEGAGIVESAGFGICLDVATDAFVALMLISFFFLLRDNLSFSLGCVGFAFLGTSFSVGAELDVTGVRLTCGGEGSEDAVDSDIRDLLLKPDVLAESFNFNFGFLVCCDVSSIVANVAAGAVEAVILDETDSGDDNSLSFILAAGFFPISGSSAFLRSFATTFNMSLANFAIHFVSRLP